MGDKLPLLYPYSRARLKTDCPHIVVGTPGRILALARDKSLNLKNCKHFVLDECDKMLEQLGESHIAYLFWPLTWGRDPK